MVLGTLPRQEDGRPLMRGDPSWDITPVANPELRDRKQRALQLAQDASESRVTVLERYAAEVLAARSAFRDLQDALRISNLNDRYLALVAHTAADEHAVTEISGLTDQVTVAVQAVRESMRQVGLAAAALALSEPAAE